MLQILWAHWTQLRQVWSVLNVSVSPGPPAPLPTSLRYTQSVGKYISSFRSLSPEKSSFLGKKKKLLYSLITMENIMRYIEAQNSFSGSVSHCLKVLGCSLQQHHDWCQKKDNIPHQTCPSGGKASKSDASALMTSVPWRGMNLCNQMHTEWHTGLSIPAVLHVRVQPLPTHPGMRNSFRAK